MKNKLHIIYVPGIMDDAYHVQGFLSWLWFLYGVRGHTHEMPWSSDESYEVKLSRLVDLIDEYSGAGNKISLIGASAGASAAINAYSKRRDKIHSVALICGKINQPETISDRYYGRNPGFKDSMYELQDNLKKLTARDKAKFHNYFTSVDQTVPYICTTVNGIEESKLPSLRHGQAILYSLSFGARRIIKHLKSVK